MRAVEIYLGGKRYLLNTDENKEYLLDLADYVNQQIEKYCGDKSKLSIEQAACFASLKIADELFKLREKHDDLKEVVSNKTETVIHSLEQSLAKRPA